MKTWGATSWMVVEGGDVALTPTGVIRVGIENTLNEKASKILHEYFELVFQSCLPDPQLEILGNNYWTRHGASTFLQLAALPGVRLFGTGENTSPEDLFGQANGERPDSPNITRAIDAMGPGWNSWNARSNALIDFGVKCKYMFSKCDDGFIKDKFAGSAKIGKCTISWKCKCNSTNEGYSCTWSIK